MDGMRQRTHPPTHTLHREKPTTQACVACLEPAYRSLTASSPPPKQTKRKRNETPRGILAMHTCASRLRPMPATGFARSSPLLSTTYSWSPRPVHTRRCGRPLIGFGLVRVGTPSLARLGGEAREGGSRMQISSDTCPLSTSPRWISLTREAGFSWDGPGTAATPHHTTPTTFRAVCVIWIRRAILCSKRKGEVFAISDR